VKIADGQGSARSANGLAAAGARRLPSFVLGLSLPLLYLATVNPAINREGLDLVIQSLEPVLHLAETGIRATPAAPASFASPEATAATTSTVALRVRRGDTLDLMFRRAGLDLGDLAAILRLEPARRHLHGLRPGDEIQVENRDGAVLKLSRDLDAFSTLNVERQAGEFRAAVVALPVETQHKQTVGRIRSSLFEAGSDAGISDAGIMKLAAIFASEIDFVLDLREGDEFSVIYDQYWRDGRKVGDGEILAAEFVNQGVRYRAVRFQTADGRADYFTPEGKSLRKAFVRAPLSFSRVSSGFNPHRLHPILHTIRAHNGTDYAAPTGTPVHAPGDGKVVFRGIKGGYGNVLMLQHPGSITTVYGHLSAFARSLREGHTVHQGEVIAYVGMTGLATAPHLHYEYRVNGVPVNSRTVKLPDATPVSPTQRPEFLRAAAPLLQQLDGRASLVAGNNLRTRPNG
jgi:murein DD-endopeptidase MepM/ murein hydrolase activator NlpD